MGWLWSSAPAPKAAKQPSSDASPPTFPELPRSNPFSPSPEHTSANAAAQEPFEPPTQVANKSPTRDEVAEAELRSFLQSLDPSPSSTTTQSAFSATDDSSSSDLDPSDPSGPIPLTSAHTLPSTVSCQTIFDNAFHCQSIGGQWNGIYRYGGLRDCSPLWSDFWWCMRTNRGSMTEDERARQVKRRYAEKESRLREGNNSEEVWEERKVLLERVWEERYTGGEEERGEVKRREGRGAMRSLYGG